jgi:hypothetical protein
MSGLSPAGTVTPQPRNSFRYSSPSVVPASTAKADISGSAESRMSAPERCALAAGSL